MMDTRHKAGNFADELLPFVFSAVGWLLSLSSHQSIVFSLTRSFNSSPVDHGESSLMSSSTVTTPLSLSLRPRKRVMNCCSGVARPQDARTY